MVSIAILNLILRLSNPTLFILHEVNAIAGGNPGVS